MAAGEAGQDVPIDGVLSWYDRTRPMWIDLVGDYAGKELFLVEGDSLLRECFEDERIDFAGKVRSQFHPATPLSLPTCPLSPDSYESNIVNLVIFSLAHQAVCLSAQLPAAMTACWSWKYAAREVGCRWPPVCLQLSHDQILLGARSYF